MNASSTSVQPLPMACTLGADDLKTRFAEIGALAGRALLSHEQDGRTLRLRYASDVAVDLERLVAKERECCGFLQFDLRMHSDGVHLDITAPTEAGEFAPLLYARFAGAAEKPDQRPSCTSACGCAGGAR